MKTSIDKLTQSGCEREKKDKICRSRGGESCAFDGAMIVLQPIADTAHIVHGPIACCGNAWEGRGTLSSTGNLHRMGFATDINEMDIVYGSEEKLYMAVVEAVEKIKPKAIFVYATCVSGLIGEDIEAACKKAEAEIGVRVIPVNAPGFVGPKNLGNRIAGEVLLDHVIGTGEPSVSTDYDINLIGEYNIAGDLWHVEPVLNDAGIRILSRITGDSTFEEIKYAHRARLNVVVCSRALINVAKEMERKYGIPYVEVSFFGKTEMIKALRRIASNFKSQISNLKLTEKVESTVEEKEKRLEERLKAYEHLKGKKAVLYTGGVKSWSFISALLDLGIEIVAVGTKKSTFEDEEKMKEILGENAPLVEDVTPKNLLRLMKERNADILVAGGRNQYLAIKEGFPFVDVNQERHTAYAGYEGLVNLAEQISNSLRFYERVQGAKDSRGQVKGMKNKPSNPRTLESSTPFLKINPLKHSQSIGAAIAFQGINNSIPVIHGAQGCTFLGKVLLTKHFREPIALQSTKLFTEDVVMGSDENLIKTIDGIIEKNNPDVIGVLTSGLPEVKGDDVQSAISNQLSAVSSMNKKCFVIHVPTPDYEGGLETGYAKAVEAVIESIVSKNTVDSRPLTDDRLVNVLAGSHLTPADFTELREIIESFGLRPVILPDLSALDGSRQGFSPLAAGGTEVEDIKTMTQAAFTIAIGKSMEQGARRLNERCGIEYTVFESLSGLRDGEIFMQILTFLSGNPVPAKYERQRRILIDGMRDAHSYFGNKKICIALEPDMAIQTSRWISEMGAEITLAVIPQNTESAREILAKEVVVSDLFSITGELDLLISNSHAEDTAKRLDVPLYQIGFPVYKIIGNNSKTTIGYRGTLAMINEAANILLRKREHDGQI
ncbi:MAG: nitrogenase iron-molybdenum cofactor biosynthesis protein NifE [Nitrospirae bacterium]|nr:nitrogenase iron-molybdenum cofactor biosynthesis protein NifE [Nitrospirota bacterium]